MLEISLLCGCLKQPAKFLQGRSMLVLSITKDAALLRGHLYKWRSLKGIYNLLQWTLGLWQLQKVVLLPLSAQQQLTVSQHHSVPSLGEEWLALIAVGLLPGFSTSFISYQDYSPPISSLKALQKCGQKQSCDFTTICSSTLWIHHWWCSPWKSLH